MVALRFFVFLLLISNSISIFSAQPINLRAKNISIILPYVSSKNSKTAINVKDDIKELNRSLDFNRTLHIHLKQTYAGYPVWGADSIVHIPYAEERSVANVSLGSLITRKNTNLVTMNGILYQNLEADLINSPLVIFSNAQSQKSLERAISLSRTTYTQNTIPKNPNTRLIIYIDQKNIAHWAFHVSFYLDSDGNSSGAKPSFILDAQSFTVYKSWNDAMTLADVKGGGRGGNIKNKLFFDGLLGNQPKLNIKRDNETGICYQENEDVIVKDNTNRTKIVNFPCSAISKDHNDVYWNENFDENNGGYSPSNDALYGISIAKNLYQDWYGIPPMIKNGKSATFLVFVYGNGWENAQIDPAFMYPAIELGMGGSVKDTYPYTSIGVITHEVSHGFTYQHSGLIYSGESGGINEAFSDMAGKAAEFYVYGKINWEINSEIYKEDGKASRYFDQPSKDCYGKQPGDACSIDNMNEYNAHKGLEVHYSSGIFNRAFYLISTAPNWNIKKAFNIMVQANMHYWTSDTTFNAAACGVVSATKDYKYDLDAVINAFLTVGIDTSHC